MSFYVCGAQVVEAQSRIWRENVMCAVIFVFCEAGLMFHVRKTIAEFAFLEIYETCLLQ